MEGSQVVLCAVFATIDLVDQQLRPLPWILVLMILMVGCTTDPSSGQSSIATLSVATSEQAPNLDCQPAITESGSIGAEVRAESPDEIEVWALIFNTWNLPYGDPLKIPANQEVKIVWRITGDGEVSFEAVGPDGISITPDWGPDRHLGSNWKRPGDEWGTGWTFPEAGCWTLLVERGNDLATISADVF